MTASAEESWPEPDRKPSVELPTEQHRHRDRDVRQAPAIYVAECENAATTPFFGLALTDEDCRDIDLYQIAVLACTERPTVRAMGGKCDAECLKENPQCADARTIWAGLLARRQEPRLFVWEVLRYLSPRALRWLF